MGLQDVFSAIGKGLKAAAPYFQPVADHLAAAAGNYKPLLNDQHEAQQQREFGLQSQLAQSNLATQDLTRQHTQLGIDNYESPADARAANEQSRIHEIQATANGAPPQVTQYMTGSGNVGIGTLDKHTGHITPATYGQDVPNPTQAAGSGMVPPAMGHLIPPVPTVNQQVPALAPPSVHFGPSGYDENGNYVTSQYDAKTGRPMLAQPAPKPVSAYPTTSNVSGTQVVQGPNGPMVIPHSSTTTRSKSVPGAASLPGVPGGQSSNASGPTARPVVDQSGNPVQRKPSATEINRADLAGNLNENIDKLEEIVNRRPELFGPYNGRKTELKMLIGSDDPDIGQLANIKHQMGMAQISAHGMRSAQGVDSAANALLNFHNRPEGLKGSFKSARDSVQTFRNDAANPGSSYSGGAPNVPSSLKPPVATSSTVIRYDAQGNRLP